jgi:MerR family transcriptional regulator, heat shock protein HspR
MLEVYPYRQTMASLPIDDQDAALYTVGQVATMLHVHHAYLRRLDECSVVSPARSPGGQRRYSRRQIGQVWRITTLTSDGLTLAGASKVAALEDRIGELEAERDAARAEAGALRALLAQHALAGGRPPRSHPKHGSN